MAKIAAPQHDSGTAETARQCARTDVCVSRSRRPQPTRSFCARSQRFAKRDREQKTNQKNKKGSGQRKASPICWDRFPFNSLCYRCPPKLSARVNPIQASCPRVRFPQR
uniref:Uncharacterized protein n=1 Tax=Anopheles atroparvus TaxID=41427 RepID=A0AAG5D9R2_ANOAO